MSTIQTFKLVHYERPFVDNTRMHWATKAKLVSEWRTIFTWLVKIEKVPPMKSVEIIVQQHCKDNRRPDVAGCFPASKAAIDGLVDGGVLVNDGPDIVTKVTFLAPICTGRDALELELIPGELA